MSCLLNVVLFRLGGMQVRSFRRFFYTFFLPVR